MVFPVDLLLPGGNDPADIRRSHETNCIIRKTELSTDPFHILFWIGVVISKRHLVEEHRVCLGKAPSHNGGAEQPVPSRQRHDRYRSFPIILNTDLDIELIQPITLYQTDQQTLKGQLDMDAHEHK